MKNLRRIVFAVVFSVMLSGIVFSAGISDELFAAIKINDIQKVKELISRGAQVNARDEDGSTPLLKAAYYGYTEIAAILIQQGADVNAKNDIMGNTPLILAASWGHFGTTKLLMEKGADVNAQAKDGQTALMGAAYSGYLEIAKLLIEKGVNLNTRHMNGETALAKAERRGMTDMVKLLRQAGAQ